MKYAQKMGMVLLRTLALTGFLMTINYISSPGYAKTEVPPQVMEDGSLRGGSFVPLQEDAISGNDEPDLRGAPSTAPLPDETTKSSVLPCLGICCLVSSISCLIGGCFCLPF